MKNKVFTITNHYLKEVEYPSGPLTVTTNWEVMVATFDDEVKVKLVESSRNVVIDWCLVPEHIFEYDPFVDSLIKKKLDSF